MDSFNAAERIIVKNFTRSPNSPSYLQIKFNIFTLDIKKYYLSIDLNICVSILHKDLLLPIE